MKIALAQINTTIGDFGGTVRKIGRFVERARSQCSDVIAFPELTLTGYPPRDLVEIPSFVDRNLRALEDVARLAQGIRIIVGYVDRNDRPGGRSLYNAAAICQDGKIAGRYYKNLLPTYDVFDEGRYFEPGTEAGLWNLGNSVGISICEDSWNDKLFWEDMFSVRNFSSGEVTPMGGIGVENRDSPPDLSRSTGFAGARRTRIYPHDPIEEQVQKGADFLLNISASPFSLGKTQFRRDMLSALALRHGLPFLYVNLVGGNDELVFDGRSLAVNSRGEIVAEGKAYEEDLLVVDLDPLSKKREKEGSPPKGAMSQWSSDEGFGGREGSTPATINEMGSVYQTLVLGLRDYVQKCGFKKVVLGLSGGIDSSLVAALAVRALGAKNVLGVSMPSPYSSKGSIEDARALAKNLKIAFEIHPIKKVYDAYRATLKRKERKGGKTPDIAEENMQSRIRGNILMALSNRYGYLVLSTGNKSELGVGYCTLYGDMSGGLSVIADVPKTMVYELSRHIQNQKAVIPEAVFTKPPSAELRPNQTDQDTLPSYEILDQILKAAIEEHKSEEEILKLGLPAKAVRHVLQCIHKNEYKRRQAAPGIKITSKAFGIGRRFPIARKL